MESYSLALQLQAAQEVVSEKMPRRALVMKILLFTEVVSALLMVQLGQFTHAGFIAIPFFLTSLVAVQREHWAHSIQLPDPRSVLLSVLSPKNYAIFGLRRGQKGIATFLATVVFLRILCLVPLAVTLRAECANPRCFLHRCDPWPKNWVLVSAERGDRPPDCEWLMVAVPRMITAKHSIWRLTRVALTTGAQRMDQQWQRCQRQCGRTTTIRYSGRIQTSVGLCGEELNLVPAMARHSCMAGTWDPLLYQTKRAFMMLSCFPTGVMLSSSFVESLMAAWKGKRAWFWHTCWFQVLPCS